MSKEEGVAKLFNGCTMATGRAILMTIGQLSFYDQIKQMLIKANLEKDNIYTHLFSSFLAASGATVLIQPMDVLRTRLMNAPPGQFKGLLDCFLYTLFVFFEQFRMRLGYIPEEKLKSIEEESRRVILESTSNQNFIGSVLHPRGNIAEFLLRDGLAKCLDWTKGLVTGSGEKLREAENFAKQRRLRIWKNFNAQTTSVPSINKSGFSAKVVGIGLCDSLSVLKDNGEELKVYFSSLSSFSK
uniref:TNase-like domain-containing protein n=4 Tax=Meloidogyne TaxID=189290 RepID=A0A915LNN3_MELJA